MKRICLISTLHDPRGRFIPSIKKQLGEIVSLFREIYIIFTDKTSSETITFLMHKKVGLKKDQSGLGSLSRRKALNLGLKSKSPFFFHIDFDRLLHWLKVYSFELKGILKKVPQNDFLILGRTKRAFKTHPRVQQETEKRTNEAVSKELRIKVDVATGCCAFSREVAKKITQYSRAKKMGTTDTEWPLIAKHFGFKIRYLVTEGLEFETNDFYPEAKQNKSFRERMTKDSIEMIKTTKKRFGDRFN